LSKVGAEQVAMAWAAIGGSAVFIARLGNLYGFLPADDTVVGRLVGQFQRGNPLHVRATGDVRDFTDVAEAAIGLVRLAQLEPEAGSGPVNVSTGVAVSVRDVIVTLASLGNRSDLRVVVDEPRALGTRLVMDVTRLRSLLGWSPSLGLEAGLGRMLANS
jgi:nucleoside-diphosphate-sugar epimerase